MRISHPGPHIRCVAFRLFLVAFLIVNVAGAAHAVALQEVATPDASLEPGEPSTLTFMPSADAHVLEGAPSQNLGQSSRLSVDNSPRTESYLRFDVTGMYYPPARVTLRLWVTNGTPHSPAVWASPHMSWSESDITWSTRPAIDREIAVGGEMIERERWLEYDLTGAIEGNGTYTFALIPQSEDGLEFHSSEADGNVPMLVIEPQQVWLDATPQAVLDAPPVVLAAGDIATCSDEGDEHTARILDEQEGVVVPLGDLAYEQGTLTQFMECYDPTWGRHKDRTMPSLGNHEYYTEDARGYFAYFGPVAGDPQRGYYSYDLGTWHIIVLNSNIDMGAESEQLAWVQQDLAANPVGCTLAYWHHPRFSSGSEHGNNEDVAPLFEVLYANGVDVALNAHDHSYERFAPQDPDAEADEEFGIRIFVVGSGGADMEPFSDQPEPNSEARNADDHGVLRLELNDGGYGWEFLAVEGGEFEDAGEGDCHEEPPQDAEATSSGHVVPGHADAIPAALQMLGRRRHLRRSRHSRDIESTHKSAATTHTATSM